MDEWIKKMWFIYTMKYHSVIKSDIIFSAWMDLEGIMLSEINQRKTNMDALSLLLKKTLFIFFIFGFFFQINTQKWNCLITWYNFFEEPSYYFP